MILIAVIAVVSFLAGAGVLYAGIRVGSKLQWSADNDVEPFKTLPKERTTETD